MSAVASHLVEIDPQLAGSIGRFGRAPIVHAGALDLQVANARRCWDAARHGDVDEGLVRRDRGLPGAAEPDLARKSTARSRSAESARTPIPRSPRPRTPLPTVDCRDAARHSRSCTALGRRRPGRRPTTCCRRLADDPVDRPARRSHADARHAGRVAADGLPGRGDALHALAAWSPRRGRPARRARSRSRPATPCPGGLAVDAGLAGPAGALPPPL